MGSVFTYQERVQCHQGHQHHSIDDARECDMFHSNRLKEEDQLNTLTRNYGGTGQYTETRRSTAQSESKVIQPEKQKRCCLIEIFRRCFVWLASLPCSEESFSCAQHHNHSTMKECNECNRRTEESRKEEHNARMAEKMNRSERQGISN